MRLHAHVHHGYFLVPQLVLENTFARDVHVCVGVGCGAVVVVVVVAVLFCVVF